MPDPIPPGGDGVEQTAGGTSGTPTPEGTPTPSTEQEGAQGAPDRGGNVPPHARSEQTEPTQAEQREQFIDQAYNIAFNDEVKRLLEEHELSERAKTLLRMRSFPEEHDQATRDEFRVAFDESVDAHPDLKEAFEKQNQDKDATVARQYEAVNNEEIRDLLDKYDLSERFRTAMKMRLFPLDYDRAVSDQFIEELDETMQGHPDLVEALGKQATQSNQEEAARDKNEDEEETEPEEKTEEDEEAFKTKQAELDKQAREAMQESIDDPLDVDKRKRAADAIDAARVHHEEHGPHGADGLTNTTPWWSHAIKGFGIAFYIFVALQWAAAATLEAYGGGGKK